MRQSKKLNNLTSGSKKKFLPINVFGKNVDDSYSAKDTMKQAELDYIVIKQQLEYNHKPVNAFGTFKNGSEFLGSVGGSYKVIQNRDMFNFADSIISASGGEYLSAGEVDNGRQIFATAKLPDSDFSIGNNGDDYNNYLCFMGSHDGSLTNQIRLINLRVACNNGLIHVANNRRLKAIKHSGNITIKLKNAQKDVKMLLETQNNIKMKLDKMSKTKLTHQSLVSFMGYFLGANWNRSSNWRKQLQVSQIAELYANPEIKSQGGTIYALLNAITNYYDHVRTMCKKDVTEAEKIKSAYFGNAVKHKKNAFDCLYNITNSAPPINSSIDKSVIDIMDHTEFDPV